jgi:hypothetical protein
MTSTDDPDTASNESWMEFFRRTKRFSDLILLAWGLVEFDTNQLVARQYGLFYTDEKAIAILEQLTFNQKLSILRKLNVISKEDYDVIQQFQRYRNKLFHGEEEASFYFIMTDAEKEPIIENVVEAVKILQALGFRNPIQGVEGITRILVN